MPAEPTRPAARREEEVERLTFTRWTGLFGGAGLLTVLSGFFLLHQGSINLAPILLVVGFLVLFPLALVK